MAAAACRTTSRSPTPMPTPAPSAWPTAPTRSTATRSASWSLPSTTGCRTDGMAETAPFDLARLEDYLRANIPGLTGAIAVEPLTGGQSNPTFVIKVDGKKRYVLRKKPAGPLLPSAHAVDREYRVMKALGGSDVPVPRMLCLCEDDSVIGTMFFVMNFADGRSFWDPALPHVDPAERSAIYGEMNRVIAALHSV